jgi:hypothetical protein
MATYRVSPSFGLFAFFALFAFAALVAIPVACGAQAPTLPSAGAEEQAAVGTSTVMDGPWEFTLEGRLGSPTGRLKVGEFPTGVNKLTGGGTPGTLLRLHTLGVDTSEVIEGTAAFHFTPRDAIRASVLYDFLRGSATIRGPSVVYNGAEFTAGSLDTNADFYRLSLDYERTLFRRPSGEQLVGSIGLTYVNFNPKLTGNIREGGPEANGGRSNSEDFYRQELPVPILGLQWVYPFAERWTLRTSLSGGFLPRVDSLRTEGGTIYLEQRHADLGLGVVYRVSRMAHIEAGYHFTYFFQEEKSHEDRNLFELFDNGLYARFKVQF